MLTSHPRRDLSMSRLSALAELVTFVEKRRVCDKPVPDFEVFEEEVRSLVAAVECEVVAEELVRHDIDVPVVLINGVAHRRVLRGPSPYLTAGGEVSVERTLYRGPDRDERAVCPMDLQVGIVEGRWTPLAGKLAAWAVAHVTPHEAEELFRRFGGMAPSKSSLDRLPKALSERWEEDRPSFESALRTDEEVPEEAATVSVSLDGVMVPMIDAGRAATRARAEAAGRPSRGPAGYREASCGTVTTYTAAGKRLETRRMARMPEAKKVALKETLVDEVEAVLDERPDLTLVKVADGAKDNWTFLESAFPGGHEVVDFYHGAEHLKEAMDSAYGKGNPRARAEFERLRHILLEESGGVDTVIRALDYQRRKHPRRKKLAQQTQYFRNNRKRMRYAEMKAAGLPIGSGVVEAACKTLVTQRLKRAGMRWRSDGGQAVLTLRALCQSDRFDLAWYLFVDTYRAGVAVPENVIPFPVRL